MVGTGRNEALLMRALQSKLKWRGVRMVCFAKIKEMV